MLATKNRYHNNGTGLQLWMCRLTLACAAGSDTQQCIQGAKADQRSYTQNDCRHQDDNTPCAGYYIGEIKNKQHHRQHES